MSCTYQRSSLEHISIGGTRRFDRSSSPERSYPVGALKIGAPTTAAAHTWYKCWSDYSARKTPPKDIELLVLRAKKKYLPRGMTLSSTVCALVASRKVPPHPTPTQPNPTQQKCSAVIRALVCVRPKMMKVLCCHSSVGLCASQNDEKKTALLGDRVAGWGTPWNEPQSWKNRARDAGNEPPRFRRRKIRIISLRST